MTLGDWHADSLCDLLVQAEPLQGWDLRDAFEGGVWVQHLQDQKNHAAPVQGVRFFIFPQPHAQDADTKWQSQVWLGWAQSPSDSPAGPAGPLCPSSVAAATPHGWQC